MTAIPQRRRIQLGESVRQLNEQGLTPTKIVFQPNGAIEFYTERSGTGADNAIDDEIKRVLGGSAQ